MFKICTVIYPLVTDAWLAILELIRGSARVVGVVSPPRIWYTPQLLYSGLSSLPINTYSFSEIAENVLIPKKHWEDAENEFRVWIRGKGANLVLATPRKMYRVASKYNVVCKKSLLSSIKRCGVTGIKKINLWGEHPNAFRWLKELENEGHTYSFGQLVVATTACNSIMGLKLEPIQTEDLLLLKVVKPYY